VQAKWAGALLNSGINPRTNQTVIPLAAFNEVTAAQAVAFGVPPNADNSIVGYGMGWVQYSLFGHNVRTTPDAFIRHSPGGCAGYYT